jgi:prevent-host-death family protein
MVMKGKKPQLNEAALDYVAGEPADGSTPASGQGAVLRNMELWPAPDGVGYTAQPHLELSAAEFKARCLALMDLLAQHGGDVVITKRGKPVAKLVPFEQKPAPSLAGSVLYEAEDCWEPRPESWAPAGAPPLPR